MKKKTKIVPAFIPTRKTARMRARHNMLQAGMTRINSKGKGIRRGPSKFSMLWREWVEPSEKETKRRAKA